MKSLEIILYRIGNFELEGTFDEVIQKLQALKEKYENMTKVSLEDIGIMDQASCNFSVGGRSLQDCGVAKFKLIPNSVVLNTVSIPYEDGHELAVVAQREITHKEKQDLIVQKQRLEERDWRELARLEKLYVEDKEA